MNSKIFYVWIFFSLLFLGNILLQSGASLAYGQDKPALMPKSTGDSPQINNKQKISERQVDTKEPCIKGTGPNALTGIPCIKCDPITNYLCEKTKSPTDGGPIHNKPGTGPGGSGAVLGDTSSAKKLKTTIQNLQTGNQEFKKTNDPTKVLTSINDLEKLGIIPTGTTQKLNSFLKIGDELEDITDGGISTDGTSQACGFICKAKNAVIDGIVEVYTIVGKNIWETVTNPCPGGKPNPATGGCQGK
jgi:hypothetical protein